MDAAEHNIWRVEADHPILGRPDKWGLSLKEAQQYATELEAFGFERVRIIPSKPS